MGVLTPPPIPTHSEIIPQYDGNITIESSIIDEPHNDHTEQISVQIGFRPKVIKVTRPPQCLKIVEKVKRGKKVSPLPNVILYNMRSFFPKQQNFCLDFEEREIDIAFLTEVWEKKEKKNIKRRLKKCLS